MGIDHRVVAVALALFSLPACRKSRVVVDEHAQPPTPPRAAASAVDVPIDRVAPGELGEGTTVAFGLRLPRETTVRSRFDDVVSAWSNAPADAVANYVRQRVDAERIFTGPQKTLFSRATVRSPVVSDGGSPPRGPGSLVSISVVSFGGRTELEVRDVTPKPSRPGLSSEERWREQGMNPDGTLADPEHLR